MVARQTRILARPAGPARLAGAGALLCIALVACGPPEPSLQQVMFQIDWEDKALAQALHAGEDPAPAAPRVAALTRLMQDPAFARYTTKARFVGSAAEFESQRQASVALLAALERAVASGERAAAIDAYRPMRAACELCHQHFRPGL
jgi:cytochrome c556